MKEKCKETITISTHNHKNLYFAVGFSENGKIVRISLPQNSLDDVLSEISKYHPKFLVSHENSETAENICKLFHGENVDIDLDLFELDLDGISTIKTHFERDVILEVAKIPYGQVKTYKNIAESLNTRAYRAVGTAIRKNPFPIIIPCHRVIRSDGRVGEYRGGTSMKMKILKNEGINIESSKIINLEE